MISMYKQNDNISAYVAKFVCDTETDIENLPTEKNKIYPGSTAVVAETGNLYILNASYSWVLFKTAASGGNTDDPLAGYDYATTDDIDALFGF